MGFWGRNTFKVKGKNVIVTGGSQGLGKAIAKELVLRGANVHIVARTISTLQQAADELKQFTVLPDQVVAFESVDLTNKYAVKEYIDNLPFCPDHVLSVAGSSKPGFFAEMDLETFEKQMLQNYFSTVYVCHAVINRMRKCPVPYNRRILLTSSITSVLPIAGYSAYSPAKAAMRALADTLRQECIMYDIEVCIYLPASISSPGFEEENRIKPELCKILEDRDPVATPEEAARRCMSGLDHGDFLITSNLIGDLMKNRVRGASPQDNLLLDTIGTVISFFGWPPFRRDLDSSVYKYAIEHQMRCPRIERSNTFPSLAVILLHLVLIYFSFPNLVQSPVPTLTKMVPSLFALQLIQVWLQRPKVNGILPSMATAILSSLGGSVLIQLIVVAFGAPLMKNYLKTFLCSVILSLLTVFPISFYTRFDFRRWRNVLTLQGQDFCGSLVYRAWGVVIGAWLGAIPIPLDWDRPWQAWPITVVTGAFLGYGFGGLIGELLK
ncbi:pig-F [Schizosaccharomyces japonicus yFS275]|uniref:3-dehydrosphinganine reductase n=1 Tax=Schizosaccharomyces japonicus (strain yFS275 / FY16936) TaxID=402676 RepID=B6K2M1_SCHJY|nr:pig-F [Schizosaccharomyces japonicus yFS275]EEB07402.1 pig-F [Schizosaccharomyces japonicus yFS275]